MTVSDSEQPEPGPGQELADSDTENHWGPGQELTQWPQPSFFCNQVFFDYDPSSSTSLLSSVSSDQGKCERGDGQGDGGFWCEGPIAGARPRTADA